MGSEASRVADQVNHPQNMFPLMTSELPNNRTAASQEALADPDFPTDLLSMFMAVASDSVALNGSQASHLQLVEALNTLLKTCVATRNVVDREASNRPGDATQANRDTLNVEIIQTFEHVLHQNAELALKRQTDLNTLNISKPSFTAQLARRLRLAAEALAKHSKDLQSCVEARTEAERKVCVVTEQNDRLSTLLEKCQQTIKLWEDKKGVILAANNLNDSICLWLSTLDGQLQSVDAKVQERDNRIAVLEAECLGQHLNIEEWKLKAQQAQQEAANAKQTTVVALEVGPSGNTATATVFQVAPNGDLSQVGSQLQVPFPYSKTCPLAVQDPSSRQSVSSMTSPFMAEDLQAYRISISLPPERAAALAKYPDIAVSLPPDVDSPAVFSRESISAVLGGNSKNHHVVLGPTATDFAKRHHITAYTMSTVERNPWSPIRAGQHGYWFLPVLKMKVPFKENDKRHVFTGTGGGPYHYCGYYRIASFGQLTLEEWLSLTSLHKSEYVRSFCRDPEDWELYGASGVNEVISKFDSGVFRVPCVQLQCVRFDVKFYKELCRENDEFFGEGEQHLGLQPLKRRRVVSEEGDCESVEGREG